MKGVITMGRSNLSDQNFKGQKLSKDVWAASSNEETEKSRTLKALEVENKLLLIAAGVIIAVFGFMVLTAGVYWGLI